MQKINIIAISQPNKQTAPGTSLLLLFLQHPRLGSIIEDLRYGQQHKSRMVFEKLKKRLCPAMAQFLTSLDYFALTFPPTAKWEKAKELHKCSGKTMKMLKNFSLLFVLLCRRQAAYANERERQRGRGRAKSEEYNNCLCLLFIAVVVRSCCRSFLSHSFSSNSGNHSHTLRYFSYWKSYARVLCSLKYEAQMVDKSVQRCRYSLPQTSA